MSADDLLPPVQAPAANFIIQLFLIPMLIVSMIVALWLLFGYLSRQNENPKDLVADIEQLNHASWQKALTLAQLLRDSQNSELRNDTELASRLSALLEKQIEEGRHDNEHNQLREYLCRSLGRFEVDTGCEALALAASTEEHPDDFNTRRAALQALAELTEAVDPEVIAGHPSVLDALQKGTEEYSENPEEKRDREILRSASTFTLGLLPKESTNSRLAELTHDPSLDVGYNAAIGLARQGDERAIPVLVEMLDPPEDALEDSSVESLQRETPQQQAAKKAGLKEWKKTHLVTNALRATTKLYGEYPQLDISELKTAIEKLSADEEQPNLLRIRADEVLRVLNQ